MEDLIKHVEKKYSKDKDKLSKFAVGDTVKVFTKFQEGDRLRKQLFEGIVIAKSGAGVRASFTVRKISYGEGVEKIFLIHSESIEKVEVIRYGDVKKAKLYYLKGRVGKRATRVKEKITAKPKKKVQGNRKAAN
ncbi:MAG: 50S ribosomal protein L19 [Candidatus Saelkia tenebricola]|nr:50S ribosomal protein L19 [Candidatus Saelkia tenebricola]